MLFGASILFAFLLAEIGLRIIGFSYPSFHQRDEILGTSLFPGTEGWWWTEGESYIHINRHGQRDRDRHLDKPDNTIRIAIIGDSYAEAMQVSLENTFASVVEKNFRECLSGTQRDVEVINFGVATYGTAQELLMLRSRVWSFNPDIVLLAFFTGNDIKNNLLSLEQDPLRPYFLLGDQQQLVLDDRFLNHPDFNSTVFELRKWLINHSRVMQVMNRTRKVILGLLNKKSQKGTQAVEPSLDDEIYLPPNNPNWFEAWAITEALLKQIYDETKKRGVQFFLVTLSNGIQVYPDQAERSAYVRKLGVTDLFYPDNRIYDYAMSLGIDVVSPAPQLQKAVDNEPQYLHGLSNTKLGFGHWNTNGHRMAGDIIASHLCKKAVQ